MSNRAEKITQQVKELTTDYDNFLDELGNAGDLKTPAKQGKYIKTVLEQLNRTKDPDFARKVMRPCGYQCISDEIISKAKNFYREAGYEMGPFLKLLNQNHIGGGNLRMEADGILLSYDMCYCGIPKAVRNMPEEYCECSAGWGEKLFSSVLEKKVRVEILQTILSGGDKCIFRITF